MTISKFLAEVFVRDPKLYRVGLFMFVLAALLVLPLCIDNRVVEGINTWIKPIKFCLSVGIYSFTMAWYLEYIKAHRGLFKLISITTAVTMLIEILIIVLQGARGQMSHFNNSTIFNQALFGTMGAMIAISTLMIVVYFFTLLTVKSTISGPYKLSVLSGIFIFLLSSGVGGVMIANDAHTVGAPDGGAGIFFFNWSLTNGDLRIAHFVGMHALQLVPLSCYFIMQKTKKLNLVYLSVVLVSLIYIAFFGALYIQAQAGTPLFKLS